MRGRHGVHVNMGADAMIKINIVAVGRLKDDFYRAAADEYVKRLSRFAEVKEEECPEGVDRGEESLKNQEAEQILKKLRGYVILLDIGGGQRRTQRDNVRDRRFQRRFGARQSGGERKTVLRKNDVSAPIDEGDAVGTNIPCVYDKRGVAVP